jgi:chromosome segregation ATPase
LQKPFFKLQSLARTGEVAVPLDEMNTISNYLSDPYFALATEENGYSVLKSILQRLNTTIGQNKLKLKQARIRKAQDQINNILNKGTLSLLQKDCTESLSQRKQLLASETITTLQNHLTLLQNQLGQLQKENELVSSRRKALQDEQAKLNDRLEYLEKELEKNIFQLTNKNAHITLFA